MSVINSNPFGPELAAPGFQPFEPGGPAGGGYAQLPAPSDGIGWSPYAPVTLPIQGPVLSVGGCQLPPGGSFQTGFGSILNQISSAIAGLFAQLGAAFGNAGAPPAPAAPAGTGGETAFANATASSSGDPHLSFAGTTAAGTAVDGHWNSMHSHGDLLDSDSFAGGYRVATQATQPGPQGVTYNASASVTTAGGATSVSMRADGSYAVTSSGANVTLEPGRPAVLGNGESVSLNADGSLTIDDANGKGGAIATTLKSNGDGGVDVTTTATGVDLGGYLVTHSDAAAAPPGWSAAAPLPAWSSATPVTAKPIAAYPQLTLAPARSGSGLEQFDPDAAATSLHDIELLS